jgi:hypothetical protein
MSGSASMDALVWHRIWCFKREVGTGLMPCRAMTVFSRPLCRR